MNLPPLFSFIPYGYFLNTRLKGTFQKISWVFVYFIPGFFLFSAFTPSFSVHTTALLIIGLILVNYVYENGYLQNDLLTTKQESNPTLRLTPETSQQLRAQLLQIFTLRTIVCLILLFFYFVLSSTQASTQASTQGFWVLCAVLLCTQCLFLLYNAVRNRLNLWLIIPLSFFRFYGFILPFVPFQSWGEFILVTLLLYPVAKFLDFCKQPKFGLSKLSQWIGPVDRFRVFYYAFLTLTLVFAVFLDAISSIYAYVSAYYCCYRILTFWAYQRSSAIRQEITQHNPADYRQ